ncbi:MAG: hypothetical protein GX230_09105 [Lentisphaerae bacterium]|jgi:CRISPR/Cas system CMR-associated protein Cmr5 small subunit|nr:hypothetical protein [Lentisphaerota bacterium]
MKNLDQIRAQNALGIGIGQGAGEGDSVTKKVTAMVRENGLLGALAFAIEKEHGYSDVFNAVVNHLVVVERLPEQQGGWQLRNFMNFLCGLNSSALRSLTAEVLAYLSYLRRFS